MDYIDQLSEIFRNWCGKPPAVVEPLAHSSGSNRKYFLLTSENTKALGAYNPDKKENDAFVHFSKVFRECKLNVPEVYHYQAENNIYLLEYLGNESLFSKLEAEKRDSKSIEQLYKETLSRLIRFQLKTPAHIDFSYCYPRSAFDMQSMQWDLNYFKYYFLKLFDLPFDEQKLEEDFGRLMNKLLSAPAHYFMYRDFQARNIMIHNDQPYFIDYQGGRKGPLQYDVASLLWQARANLSNELRQELLDHYLHELQGNDPVASDHFMDTYYLFVYLRIFQVLGAYGFRGKIEQKQHFIKSIPYALENLEWLIENHPLPPGLEYLNDILRMIPQKAIKQPLFKAGKLNVYLTSFSYKKGIPNDPSGNGGGFVFDCRALPNPGRQQKYRDFNGKDTEVIDYLKQYKEVDVFLKNAFALIDQSVSNYKKRKFSNLMIAFGCTGGQHRSVYCAEKCREHLEQKRDANVIVMHTNLKNKVDVEKHM